MPLKKLNPTTPGQRFRIAPDFSTVITARKPEKSLLVKTKRTGGRNNRGRITVPHRGGGHKRRARLIDFKRRKFGILAFVHAIEYDPMRTAYIALLHYVDGEKSYIIAPEGLKVGAKVVAGSDVPIDLGNAMEMKDIPLGTIIHNIELAPGRGAALARSAGSYAQLLSKSGKYVAIKLPSGERRLVLGHCMATIGSVSNSDHDNVTIAKAGRSRWLGKRPRVRAVVMNPVDHPMGGGEGKASGGHPRSVRGLYTKGKKTRNRNKYSARLIISKKKK
ncbi:50S ribosomal protein L2 [Cardinium endosymbiont of Oedothorax gibbosus]|uniref:50S ribosomal protein L2 n=1 Tax=Cardinium endosymbiont of Oedothorax gibbosus TaxID=931101 RepID=UPI0020243CFF|nr:50S ribosomal protein L2 [Cardinium endosymbiont of Oedothorax gibbosus]CAH2559718.1 50S ribosomal protein L2 [Cardinium endosymbiont of Oedothorax gibbosus]